MFGPGKIGMECSYICSKVILLLLWRDIGYVYFYEWKENYQLIAKPSASTGSIILVVAVVVVTVVVVVGTAVVTSDTVVSSTTVPT